MATAAQILANQANARRSTGPRTEEGKSRSARNHTTHGLSLGVFVLDPADRDAVAALARGLEAEIRPAGALQREAFHQMLDGMARLHTIRRLTAAIIARCEADPLVVPETEPELRALTRYRAAAEMLVYRTLQVLTELQTTALHQAFHVTPDEAEIMPPAVRLKPKICVGLGFNGYRERDRIYHRWGRHNLPDLS